MKQLILVRHAKSSWSDMSLRDIDRPLNQRGKRDAPFMAKHLKSVVPKIDAFLVSPAKRARKTAKKFFKLYPDAHWQFEDLIYEASPNTLESIIYGLEDDLEVVVMFGHNPGFTYLANRYTDSPFDNLPTCGIAVIELNDTKWTNFHPSSAKLSGLYFPKQFI